MSRSDFAGLRAIVSGGASGIGLATAAMLEQRGATVASLDLNPQTEGPIHGVACDVSDSESVDTAVQRAAELLGGIDIVVNNAGMGAQGAVGDNDDEEWMRVFDVNVVGMARISRAALPYLLDSSSAAIVNVGSIAAWAGLPQRAVYSATKGAVHALTLAMAADHVRQGCLLYTSPSPRDA